MYIDNNWKNYHSKKNVMKIKCNCTKVTEGRRNGGGDLLSLCACAISTFHSHMEHWPRTKCDVSRTLRVRFEVANKMPNNREREREESSEVGRPNGNVRRLVILWFPKVLALISVVCRICTWPTEHFIYKYDAHRRCQSPQTHFANLSNHIVEHSLNDYTRVQFGTLRLHSYPFSSPGQKYSGHRPYSICRKDILWPRRTHHMASWKP